MSSICVQLHQLAYNLIRKHPNVDFGGCCVVAAHMAKCLSKFLPVRIVVGNRTAVNLDKIRKSLDDNFDIGEWEVNGVDFNHVLIEFQDPSNNKWYAFDATDGPVKARYFWQCLTPYYKARGNLTIEEATALANTNSWNRSFDRAEIPTVRRRISRFFNTVDWNSVL